MDPILLEATPTFEDYRRAFGLPNRRRIFYRSWTSFFAFIVAISTLAANMLQFGLIIISLVLACQLVYTVVELATVLRRGFDESRAWQLTYRFEFDDAGVCIITEHARRVYAWAAFLRWTEGRHFLSLYALDGESVLIPKRALTSTQCEQLRAILCEKIVPNSIAGREAMMQAGRS